MNSECRGYLSYKSVLCVVLSAVFFLSGCSNPEKAKAEHVKKGEAYLAESKFQEASLEFRNAIQIDDKLAPAHWGLARAFESLGRAPEMMAELQKTVDLDPKNLDARIKLGNYYLAGSKGRPEIVVMAEQLADDVLQKDSNSIEGHILKGSIYFSKGDKDKAFEQLNTAIQIDPKRIESYLSLSRFYVITKEFDKAEQMIKQGISVNPNSPLGHVEYGKLLAQTNRIGEAETEFRTAVEVSPNDRPARQMLAGFYIGNKQFDKAEEAIKGLVGLDPNKPDSQAVLADFYSTINRTDEAVKIYQDLITKSPDFMMGRYRLAEILLQRGDVQGATEQVNEALKKDASDRQALLLRARIRAQDGQPDSLKAAIEDLKEVLRQEPTSRAGLYYMAQSNFNLGLVDQARVFAADLERNYPDYLPAKLMKVQITLASGDAKNTTQQATELINTLSKTAPDRESSPQLLAEIRQKAYLARGSAQLRLRNLSEARKDFEAARDVSPNDPAGYNNLALVSLSENKLDDAVASWENALKVDPTNFTALNGLIGVYATNKELDKAHARVDQVLSSNPNNASLHFLKAQVFGYQQNAQGAEGELRKALEVDPNYIAAYSSLGALFINSHQEERAIAEYRNIIAKRPDDPAAYTMIGLLEDSLKNYDAAAENYKIAIAKDPNAIIAANNLAWLYAVTGKGNLDEAVRLAQGVVQKNPTMAGFVDTLGWVYYKKGLYAAAVEQLQKAVSLDEDAARKTGANPSANYQYHLGMALKAKGDAQGAKRALEASIRLYDKNHFADIEEARKALTTL